MGSDTRRGAQGTRLRLRAPGVAGARRAGRRWLAASAAGVVLLSGCGTPAGDTDASSGGNKATGDTLAVRLVADIQNLDPAFMVGSVDDAVMLNVAENLVTFRPGGTELMNELAADFSSSDDGLAHEFRLKEGMLFHSGFGEVTAEDVKFSYERIAGLTEPKIESPYQGDWAALKEVEVTGKYTGVIRLNKPFAPLLLTTLPGHAGMVISRAAFKERGDDFATNPVGSGPYEFVEWKRGQHVLLRRFEEWGGAGSEIVEEPQWKEIRFRPITDDSAAAIALEAGDVQFGVIPPASVDRFSDDERFEVTRQTTLDYGWIGFNVTHPKLADVKVRRAIRQALDVDSMIEAAFEGQVTRAHALVAPDMPVGHWADAPKHSRDVKAAKGLLEEAGVKGLQLEMSINEEPGARVVAEVVQANLAEIGIEVSIRMRAEGEMKEQVASLEMFYSSFSNQADPSWATVWFTGDQVGTWNFMSWANDEFDSLHEAALVETDPAARNEMYLRMQEIMEEEAVATWVMYRTQNYASAADLEPSLVTPRYGKYRAWATTTDR